MVNNYLEQEPRAGAPNQWGVGLIGNESTSRRIQSPRGQIILSPEMCVQNLRAGVSCVLCIFTLTGGLGDYGLWPLVAT